MVVKLAVFFVLLFAVPALAQEPVIFGAPNQGVITQGQVVNAPPAAAPGFFLHIYAQTWSMIEPPLTQLSTGMAGRLFDYVRPNMRNFILLFLTITFAGSVMRSMGQDFLMRFLPHLVAASLFLTTFLTLPFYLKTVVFLWTNVPTHLIAAITGNGTAQNVPGALDISQVKSVLGATTILEGISTGVLNPQTWVVAFLVVVDIVAAVIAHMVMFGCFVALAFVGSLLVGIGPVALAFGPFPRTQTITVNWLSCLAATMLAIALLVATLVLIIGIQSAIATQLLTLPGNGQGTLGQQILGLAIAGGVYVMFAWLAKLCVPLAGAIFSGVTGSVNAIIGAPAAAGNAGYRAVAGGGSSSGSPHTAASPPGRPLGRTP